MAVFGVRIACYEHGITMITLNFNCQRSGSNNDNCEMRIVRRAAGFGDYILPGTPDFTMFSDKTAAAWTFVDPDVPATGAFDYIVQVKKKDGNGIFYDMYLSAIHSKR